MMKIIYSKISLPSFLAFPIEGKKELDVFYKYLVKNILNNYKKFKDKRLSKSQFENYIKNDINFEYISEIGDVIKVDRTDKQSLEANLVELMDFILDVRDHGFDNSGENFIKLRLMKE